MLYRKFLKKSVTIVPDHIVKTLVLTWNWSYEINTNTG